jgi:hypothetical protein
MNRQRGLALSALLVWGVVITLVAILVIRVLPEVMDYYKIRQAVKAVAAESGGKTVPGDFGRRLASTPRSSISRPSGQRIWIFSRKRIRWSLPLPTRSAFRWPEMSAC